MKRKEFYKSIEKEFLTPQSPYIAYLLGFIWADGHIEYNPKKFRRRVSIEIKRDDFLSLWGIINKFGGWRQYFRARTLRNKVFEMGTARISNKKIIEFLVSHGYTTKFSSPDSLIKVLPAEIRKYFFRGLFDGDGSFHFNKDRWATVFNITGCFEQDWTFMENLCKQLNVKYRISRRHSQGTKRSDIIINNVAEVVKISEFIFDGFESDRIGLYRKFEVFQEIKQYFLNKV